MPQMLLCSHQRGCAQVGSVTEEDCSVAAAAGARMLGAGSAGGQAVLLLASTRLLCQHTCHAQTPVQRYPVSCQPLKLLSGDISPKLAGFLQLSPLLHSALLHSAPAKSSLLLYSVCSSHFPLLHLRECLALWSTKYLRNKWGAHSIYAMCAASLFRWRVLRMRV